MRPLCHSTNWNGVKNTSEKGDEDDDENPYLEGNSALFRICKWATNLSDSHKKSGELAFLQKSVGISRSTQNRNGETIRIPIWKLFRLVNDLGFFSECPLESRLRDLYKVVWTFFPALCRKSSETKTPLGEKGKQNWKKTERVSEKSSEKYNRARKRRGRSGKLAVENENEKSFSTPTYEIEKREKKIAVSTGQRFN